MVLHAPGITFGVGGSASALARLGRGRASRQSGRVEAPIVTSGMTSATDELAFSRASSPADTVAAKELISWNCLTCVAWTWLSSVISGFWLAAIVAARTAAAALPTCCCANWLFMITMTRWFTFLDSCAASDEVSGAVS